jgi:hypothetical protein
MGGFRLDQSYAERRRTLDIVASSVRYGRRIQVRSQGPHRKGCELCDNFTIAVIGYTWSSALHFVPARETIEDIAISGSNVCW